MYLNQLILSLILIWAPFRSAYAMPTSKVVVELSACGMSPESSHTLLSQQVSFPPWILSADRANREVPSAKRSARQSSKLKNTASAMRRVSVQLCCQISSNRASNVRLTRSTRIASLRSSL